MQILLGVNETIIKINSKSTKIDYIQHFINTHFENSTIKNNSIFIPESYENCYHRTFLLKWLYTLYAKKSNNYLPQLKESLINRQHKPIKILLPKKIIHRITYLIYDKETLHITIQPQNSQIAYKLKSFLLTKITILPTYLSVNIKTKEEKELFKRFIYSKSIIDIPHLHIYDKKKMESFLKIEQKVLTKVDKAYMTLEISSDYDAKSLKKQYKKLAKEFHPDKVISKDIQTINLFTSKFQNILDAYEILLEKINSKNLNINSA